MRQELVGNRYFKENLCRLSFVNVDRGQSHLPDTGLPISQRCTTETGKGATQDVQEVQRLNLGVIGVAQIWSENCTTMAKEHIETVQSRRRRPNHCGDHYQDLYRDKLGRYWCFVFRWSPPIMGPSLHSVQ